MKLEPSGNKQNTTKYINVVDPFTHLQTNKQRTVLTVTTKMLEGLKICHNVSEPKKIKWK